MQKSLGLPPAAESSFVYSSGRSQTRPFCSRFGVETSIAGEWGSRPRLDEEAEQLADRGQAVGAGHAGEPASGERDQILLDVFLLDLIGPQAGRVARGEVGEELAERRGVGADGLGAGVAALQGPEERLDRLAEVERIDDLADGRARRNGPIRPFCHLCSLRRSDETMVPVYAETPKRSNRSLEKSGSDNGQLTLIIWNQGRSGQVDRTRAGQDQPGRGAAVNFIGKWH